MLDPMSPEYHDRFEKQLADVLAFVRQTIADFSARVVPVEIVFSSAMHAAQWALVTAEHSHSQLREEDAKPVTAEDRAFLASLADRS